MSKSTAYIYGIHAVQEALRSGREIEKILAGNYARGNNMRELLSDARIAEIPIQYVPQEKLNSFTRKNHQGIVAVISPVAYQPIEQIIPFLFEQGKNPFILVLDGITDVRNLGAIARTAECAGADAIVLPIKGSAQVTADAIKTSAGALNELPVCRSMHLTNTIKYLRECGLKIFGSTEKVDHLYFKSDYSSPLALVLGSEGTGISPEILKLCDELVSIPIIGSISSLNVSVAASLLIYEIVRQREFNHRPAQ